EITQALRIGVVTGKIVPVLAGSALKNIGFGLLMNAINSYLPSPAERQAETSHPSPPHPSAF
ncbi:MAG: hypothetical protein NTX06_11890, partial [Proteobacteria bacterium]|nr:hypothetical protein [Pseudomonadota bacterium]